MITRILKDVIQLIDDILFLSNKEAIDKAPTLLGKLKAVKWDVYLIRLCILIPANYTLIRIFQFIICYSMKFLTISLLHYLWILFVVTCTLFLMFSLANSISSNLVKPALWIRVGYLSTVLLNGVSFISIGMTNTQRSIEIESESEMSWVELGRYIVTAHGVASSLTLIFACLILTGAYSNISTYKILNVLIALYGVVYVILTIYCIYILLNFGGKLLGFGGTSAISCGEKDGIGFMHMLALTLIVYFHIISVILLPFIPNIQRVPVEQAIAP